MQFICYPARLDLQPQNHSIMNQSTDSKIQFSHTINDSHVDRTEMPLLCYKGIVKYSKYTVNVSH